MDFGEAVKAAKQGNCVARAGWNGKGMYLFYIAEGGWSFTHMETMAPDVRKGHRIHQGFLAMKTAQDSIVPWLASQTDVLAGDWEIATAA